MSSCEKEGQGEVRKRVQNIVETTVAGSEMRRLEERQRVTDRSRSIGAGRG